MKETNVGKYRALQQDISIAHIVCVMLVSNQIDFWKEKKRF